MSWFAGKYIGDVKGTPVMIHPLRTLGKSASEVEGMRIMTEYELMKLRKALNNFAKSLGAEDILNSQDQINKLLATHQFNGNQFLNRYTTTLK